MPLRCHIGIGFVYHVPFSITPDDLMRHWQTYNTLNQAPCETAAYLAAECHGGSMSLLSPVLFGNRVHHSLLWRLCRIYSTTARFRGSLHRTFRFRHMRMQHCILFINQCLRWLPEGYLVIVRFLLDMPCIVYRDLDTYLQVRPVDRQLQNC